MDKVSRLVLTLAISLALALLVACQQTADAEAEVVPAETVAVEAMAGVLSWQTQYDLGMKYLSEGNYEEAVIAFTAAIELEPKKADAYLGMADVYIAQNNFDAAIAILEQGLAEMDDEALQARLDELNEGNVSDFWGNVRKVSTYDGSGLLIRYEEYEYIDGKKSMITCYDGDGIQIGQGNLLYDANGNTLQTYIYAPGYGTLIKILYEYDSLGNQIYCATYMPDDGALLDYYILEYNGTELVKESCYFADGELDYCEEYETLADGTKYERRYDCDGQLIYCYQREFNDDGKEVSLTCYTYDGSIEWYCTYQYDNNGNYSGHTEFDNEGNITSATTYD